MEEPPTFTDIFKILECNDDDIKCILIKRPYTIYQARKMYVKKDDGDVCEDGWIIYDKIGEASAEAEIFNSKCSESKEDKPYVAKISNIEKHSDIQKSMNEILIQNKVYKRFPFITIPIYQSFIEKNNKYIISIMDFIPGRTVGTYMVEAIKDINNIQNMTDVIAYCKKLIKYLFYNGYIVHGDTHLNNFMIDDENTIKMIDFGKGKEIISLNSRDIQFLEKKPELFKGQYQKMLEKSKDKYIQDIEKLDESLQRFGIADDIPNGDQIINNIIDDSNIELRLYDPNTIPILKL